MPIIGAKALIRSNTVLLYLVQRCFSYKIKAGQKVSLCSPWNLRASSFVTGKGVL